MDDREKLEYETLSEDRRRALSIYITGFTIFLGVAAFSLKVLVESQNKYFAATAGVLSILFASLGIPVQIRCRATMCQVHKRLSEIAEKNGFAPIIHTVYILDTGLIASMAVHIMWIGTVIYLLAW